MDFRMGQPILIHALSEVAFIAISCKYVFKDTFYLNSIGFKEQTWGTETSKYPEERISTDTPLVVASERGSAKL